MTRYQAHRVEPFREARRDIALFLVGLLAIPLALSLWFLG